MYIARALGIVVLVSAFLAFSSYAAAIDGAKGKSVAAPAPAQQIVESIDIQGNRRLRDDDLIYYIKTRPGDVYDPAALERDRVRIDEKRLEMEAREKSEARNAKQERERNHSAFVLELFKSSKQSGN